MDLKSLMQPWRNRRTSGNLQLEIELQQFKIGQRDVADEAQHHAPASFLGRRELCPGGFVQTPDAAPEVNLPGGVQSGQRRISGVAAVRISVPQKFVAPPADGTSVINRWKKLGARLGADRPRLFDPGGGSPHIIIIGERGSNERLERRVPVNIPPRQVRERIGVCHGRRTPEIGR